MISSRGWRSVAATGMALIVLGCGGRQTGLDSQVGPSPVVLKDTSPGQLAVSVALNLGGYDTSTRDKTVLDVNFQQSGRPVEFTGGESVTCTGVALKRFIGSFEVTLPTASIAGRAMTCVYTSGQQSAPLTFRVPKELVILMPREHEPIPHGPRTIVTYSGDPDNTLWVVALSPNAKAIAPPDAITATSATLDTSALQAGEGSIALTDPTSLPLTEIQGPQFHSVGGSARRMTMVAVVWV
jgi:hypothetical protein